MPAVSMTVFWLSASVCSSLVLQSMETCMSSAGKGKVVSKEGPGIFLQGLAVYDRLGVLEKGGSLCSCICALPKQTISSLEAPSTTRCEQRKNSQVVSTGPWATISSDLQPPAMVELSCCLHVLA